MQVLITWFGDFPEAESFSRQAFSVSMAVIGLAAFAIVLALVEQVLPSWQGMLLSRDMFIQLSIV